VARVPEKEIVGSFTTHTHSEGSRGAVSSVAEGPAYERRRTNSDKGRHGCLCKKKKVSDGSKAFLASREHIEETGKERGESPRGCFVLIPEFAKMFLSNLG